jgi:Zn finger protein HypA/HybF involved in hydrogenase expression
MPYWKPRFFLPFIPNFTQEEKELCFMPYHVHRQCQKCQGVGIIDTGFIVQRMTTCPECHGKKYIVFTVTREKVPSLTGTLPSAAPPPAP